MSRGPLCPCGALQTVLAYLTTYLESMPHKGVTFSFLPAPPRSATSHVHALQSTTAWCRVMQRYRVPSWDVPAEARTTMTQGMAAKQSTALS